MRFLPTNFARPKARADSTSEGPSTTSASLASKAECALDDLVKQAAADANWQHAGRGRGRGRGAGRMLTTFGGGAGEMPGGAGPAGGRRVWSGIAGRGAPPRRGGRGAAGAAKAAAGVKAEGVTQEDGGEGKAEDGEAAAMAVDGPAGAPVSWEEEASEEEDPIGYDQYYPTMLPHRCVPVRAAECWALGSAGGWGLLAGRGRGVLAASPCVQRASSAGTAAA